LILAGVDFETSLFYFYSMQTQTDFNNTWRKVASSIYRKPVDSKILGFVELDITDLEEYIKHRRSEGLKITLTHIFTLAVARALATEVPELNTYVRRGYIVQREHIDAMVSVLLREQQMGTIHVPDADKMTLKEVSEYMHDEIRKSRKGDENKTMRLKGMMAAIPWPFRNWLYKLLKRITIDWGLSLPSIGLGVNSFGSFVVTNIGSIGLDMGFPALFPVSNVAIVFVLGGVSEKPWVVNGEIKIRKIVSLGAALDHRAVDASHGGRLFTYLKSIAGHPEVLELKPSN
jgi:pyruvate dehydrogenase E2 component (dihydrolipoamide acetyltransferase)